MVDTFKPQSLQEAVDVLSDKGAILFAGGTDLMVQRRRRGGLIPDFDRPVILIGHLKELKEISNSTREIRIGSCCTYTALLSHKAVPEILKTCVSQIASPGIRNRGTIGGNICNASPAGDTLPVLYALDASVILARDNKERVLPIEKFIKGPGTTVLEADELLTRIIIPHSSFNKFFYKKVGTRAYNALSKISFTGLALKKLRAVEDVRIAFGAVSPTVVRSKDIEAQIRGKDIDAIQKMIPEILSHYSKLIDPISDQRSNRRYRKTVSLNLLNSFLKNYML
ncbi:MAG: FAD binding domain-containing protein [Spirochaetota bacterium]|nr:MAG: FAD binding domain-containing protein [Spirochaetota bacterium]